MATKEQKQNQKFAEKLLQIQGIDYDTWLDEKHQEIIQSNQALILEALDNKLNKKPPVVRTTKETETNSVLSSVTIGSSNN